MRELNQHTAQVMARVEAGERVAVTRNGVQIAVIEPVVLDPLVELIGSGQYRPAQGPLPLVPADRKAAGDSLGAEAVADDRDDRQ